ncbi:MAG TPA: non-homologous end-joining DNA ligase [Thermoanaerobaculia bacterium]
MSPKPKATPKAKAASKATGKAAAAPQRLPIRVSNPTKVFWPQEGYTKVDMLLFYVKVWPRLGPYLKDRLLSLERCPDGMLGDCFYQKEKPHGLPPDTPTKKIEHDRGVTNTVVGGKLETQLGLANLGCIAIHVWGSRARDPRKPDWVCFDLDPSTGSFADAARAGLLVGKALEALKLPAYPKTSGSRGMHVFVPIKVGPDTSEVLEFAQTLSARLAAAYPNQLTVEGRVASRGDRVYLDALRNGHGQTVVSPWCLRRRPKAPYSAPLAWKEVDPRLDPSSFNLSNVEKRLAAPDPWEDFWDHRASLKDAMKAIRRL